jgi:hypothetical protein
MDVTGVFRDMVLRQCRGPKQRADVLRSKIVSDAPRRFHRVWMTPTRQRIDAFLGTIVPRSDQEAQHKRAAANILMEALRISLVNERAVLRERPPRPLSSWPALVWQVIRKTVTDRLGGKTPPSAPPLSQCLVVSDDELVAQRRVRIEQIARELREIGRAMAVVLKLLAEQDPYITRIDTAVSESLSHTEGALAQLARYWRRLRRGGWW